MSKKGLITGIDIGSHSVKVIIAQKRDGRKPLILGTGIKPTHGIKNGYITNPKDVARSLQKAIQDAEESANMEIDSAYVSIGGVGLDSVYSKADLAIPRAEAKINDADLKRALAKARQNAQKELVNRVVLHEVPLKYLVDGKEVLGEPLGLAGNKLSVEAMFITSLETHFNSVKDVLNDLGVDVIDTVAAPIAASLVVLSSEQKEAGCVLANLGAETLSIAVFEDGNPISLKVFPIGSSDITNEIALKLQVPLKEAEELKKGSLYDKAISQKKIDDIVASRLKDMFAMIQAHLKEIGKNGLLPAGVILTGGGVGLANIKDLARQTLKLPSEIANLKVPNRSVKDSTWAVAYGLCIYGSLQENSESFIFDSFDFKIFSKIKEIFKHFIP